MIFPHPLPQPKFVFKDGKIIFSSMDDRKIVFSSEDVEGHERKDEEVVCCVNFRLRFLEGDVREIGQSAGLNQGGQLKA